MIKEVTIYETNDGSQFDTRKEADEYESPYEKCEKKMSQLHTHIDNSAVQQDVELVKRQLEVDINKEILESLKKDTPWTSLDWKNYKDNLPKNDEEFRERLLEISKLIQKAIDGRKEAEPDAILVGSNGQLLQLYGKATTHDWVVWYVNEFKKGKI